MHFVVNILYTCREKCVGKDGLFILYSMCLQVNLAEFYILNGVIEIYRDK